MAGAMPTTSLGAGYVVGRWTPRVIVRETLGRYHVCVRARGATWAEIVAETTTRQMADDVVRGLRQRDEKETGR